MVQVVALDVLQLQPLVVAAQVLLGLMVRALQVLGRGFGLSRAGAAHNTLRRGRGG